MNFFLARISWSLNFGPTKDSVSLGGYQAWAKAYPYSLNWYEIGAEKKPRKLILLYFSGQIDAS
jgi:hypothetical protein